jgi:hypothetical protein
VSLLGEQPEFNWEDDVPKRPFKGKLELSYERYDEQNSHVYFVLLYQVLGWIDEHPFDHHLSIQSFIEGVRWDKRLQTKKTKKGFKLGNNYAAFYARRINIYLKKFRGIRMFFILHKQKIQCSFGPLNEDLPDGGDNSADD